MILQKIALGGVVLTASLGFGFSQSATAVPLPASGELLISQTTSTNEIRIPGQVNRIYQNETFAEVELLTTGETVTVELTDLPEGERDFTPGDYVLVVYDDENLATADVVDLEEVSEEEANTLLTELESEETTVEGTTSTTETRTETTVQTQQQTTPRPAPAPAPQVRPAPAPAPAPTQPVRALW